MSCTFKVCTVFKQVQYCNNFLQCLVALFCLALAMGDFEQAQTARRMLILSSDVKPSFSCCDSRFRVSHDDLPLCGTVNLSLDVFNLLVGAFLLNAVRGDDCQDDDRIFALAIWWSAHAAVSLICSLILISYGCRLSLSDRPASSLISAVLFLHILNGFLQVRSPVSSVPKSSIALR